VLLNKHPLYKLSFSSPGMTLEQAGTDTIAADTRFLGFPRSSMVKLILCHNVLIFAN
jgi:polygalacturonase